jgi:glycosyltransferase involved in cell wall biosynthesis
VTHALHIAHVLRKYDAAELGGTETHVAEITRRLEQRGVSCEVHAPRGGRGSNDTAGGQALSVPLVRYRAHCPFLGSKEQRRALWSNAGNLVSFEEPLKLALDARISLVHLHTAGRIGGGVRVAMRLTGRPYIVSVHGPMLSGGAFLSADIARRTRGTIDLGKPYGLLVGARRVLDDAARVICFNDDEARALEARVGDRVRRMDHGVDRARFSAGDAARARSRWPALGAAPLVLLLGRLCAQKDQLLALRAFASAAPRDHLLVFAGAETDRGYRAMLEEEASKLGVRERLRLLGNVAAAAVPDLVAAATLCIAPSQHEAFGLVVLEAWSAGKAVLFAKVGGLRDLADALGAGAPALAERDPKSWADALSALLKDPTARERAAQEGALLLERRFTWDRAAGQLADLYREVVEETRTRAA